MPNRIKDAAKETADRSPRDIYSFRTLAIRDEPPAPQGEAPKEAPRAIKVLLERLGR